MYHELATRNKQKPNTTSLSRITSSQLDGFILFINKTPSVLFIAVCEHSWLFSSTKTVIFFFNKLHISCVCGSVWRLEIVSLVPVSHGRLLLLLLLRLLLQLYTDVMSCKNAFTVSWLYLLDIIRIRRYLSPTGKPFWKLSHVTFLLFLQTYLLFISGH